MLWWPGVLALGVAACGDDVQLVEPAPPVPPPPPPLTASMVPASATVAVGGSVVFAVNASGGAVGESASWTCASSNTGIATASNAGAGCEATGVAAGGVTITASVTKGGETQNVAAQLTVTDDQGDPAFLVVTSITGENNTGVSGLQGRVDVVISIERGDQDIEELSLLVDGVVVGSQALSPPPMIPPEDGPAEQAVYQYPMSFESHDYDRTTGAPTYANGDHTISAELEIGVTMAGGMHGHETISSNVRTVQFDNNDFIAVRYDGLGDAVPNPTTGQPWYGGPRASVEIIALPVLYSSGGVSSLTLNSFCGAPAATDSAAPFEFPVNCVGTTPNALPSFTVSGTPITTRGSAVYLDFEGPGQPHFVPNPNGREGGWINAAVAFTSTSTRNDDSWLRAGAADTGVGGYTPQLRFAAVTSSSPNNGLTEALAAMPFQTVPPGAVPDSRSGASYCVVASAVDRLGNESDLPSASTGTCQLAGTRRGAGVDGMLYTADDIVPTGYEQLVDSGTSRVGYTPTATQVAALENAGLRAGVDTTPPVAVFTGASTSADATSITLATPYQLHLTDNRGLRAAAPLVDTLQIRDRSNMTTGAATTVAFTPPSPLANVAFAPTSVGYYTYTAQAQDQAGNLSAAVSRVALHDPNSPAAAIIVARGSNASTYAKTLVAGDDLSIRDYTVGVGGDAGFALGMIGARNGTGVPTVVRLKLGPVDHYNATLTQSRTVSDPLQLPFIAVKADPAGLDTDVVQGDVVNVVRAYVADQAGSEDTDSDPVAITVGPATSNDIHSVNGRIMAAAGTGYVLDAETEDGDQLSASAPGITVTRNEQTFTVNVTATVPLATTANPFANGVYFYVEVPVGTGATQRDELRLIGMVPGIAASLRTTTNRVWTFETDVNADDYYRIVGSAASANNIHALGVNSAGVALHMREESGPNFMITIANR